MAPLALSNASIEARNARLAIGRSGRVHVAFQQAKLQSQGTPDTTPYNIMHSFLERGDATFTLPMIISDAQLQLARSADFPSLAEAPNGVLAVAWEERSKQTAFRQV